jgi:hypothetical protein
MRLKRKKSSDSAGQEKAPKKKQKGLEVAKVEVSDNTVKFFVAKGLGKKQWIVVKEIPVLDIEHIEKLENELTVTWKGTADAFFTKEKTDLFGKLVDQVNTILEDQRKTSENNEKVSLRKSELLGAINASVGIIDSSFDVLIGLQEKRINWQRLEGCYNGFKENLSFTAQTMPPLNLDFSKISSAIKSQIPKEASNEAFSILEAVYGYFNGLNLDEDLKEDHPNFHDVKAVILAYFMLNDVFLGKVVGDKENSEEVSQLEGVLQNLAGETNFKVNIDDLKGNIDKMGLDIDKEKVIERSRKIFKEQLKQHLKPNDEFLTTTHCSPKNEAITEPVAPPTDVAQPAPEASLPPGSSPEVQA